MVRISHFDDEVGEYQTNWRKKYRLAEGEFGKQNGVEKEYILPVQKWMLSLWQPIREPLQQYIRVSGIQPNAGKHNLKSSWTQCANLFFPFRQNVEMRRILACFLAERLDLPITDIEGLELEYAAPGKLEPKRLLGELKGMRGSGQTSPDVAILFSCKNGSSGIFLLENKYTEHSFYDCSGAKKVLGKSYAQRGLPVNNDPERCKHALDILDNPAGMCHQEQPWGRKYWTLLQPTFDKVALGRCTYCPALGGGYQLFRQQALAQGLINSKLFDYVISGVAYDRRNTELITCLRPIGIENFASGWSGLFNTEVRFHCFTHQDWVKYVASFNGRMIERWVDYMSGRYGYEV